MLFGEEAEIPPTQPVAEVPLPPLDRTPHHANL